MYHNIGHQSTEKCLLDKDTKTPMLEYTGYVDEEPHSIGINCKKLYLYKCNSMVHEN